MKCFYKKYVLHVRRCEYLFARDYILYYYISRPLTVYYALQTNVRHFIYQRYVIHNIVTACAREYENNLEAWVLLLHITRIQKLTIVIIGPEIKDCYSYGQLCKKCIIYKKEILFVFKSVLYHDYIESSKNYKQYLDIYNKPNIIIGFEMNLKECEERMKYVKVIQKLSCPLLLTFSSQFIMETNINLIENVLCIKIHPECMYSNSFASLLPCIDWMTGRTSFYNKYLLVSQNLG